MKKKVLNLFICFLAAISFFLFDGSVRADYDIDTNGTPGTGGKDPCDPWSYVCIYNYAAFKVTYYQTNNTKSSKIYYTDKYNVNPFKKKNNKELDGRFGKTTTKESIDSSDYDLGDVPKTFTSEKAQKFYEKLWKKIKDKDSKLIKKIFADLMKATDDSKIEEYIKNHKNDVIFIEPLYQVKIQNWTDAHKALTTKKGNFETYWGPTYGIAKKVVDQYSGCVSQGGSTTECDEIFKSRKKKGHVSRIANSLRLTKKVSVGSFSLNAGTPKAVRKKTRMDDLTGKKGYGIGSFTLKDYSTDEPPSEQNLGTCYSYIEDNIDANCDEDSENYQLETNHVASSDNKTEDAISCIQGSQNQDGTYQSHSIYGKKVSNKIQTYDVGDYCAIYCEEDISFSSDISKIVGMKEIAPLPAIQNSSTTYYDKFKITKEEKYTCHVDVEKYYGNDRPTDDWFATLGDNNYAKAYFDIETAKKTYDSCLVGVSLGTGAKKECLQNFKSTVSDLNTELKFCANYSVIESDIINNTVSNLNIKINGTEVTLKANSDEANFENKQNIPSDSSVVASEWDGDGSTFGTYINSIQSMVNKIVNQGYITYDKTTSYTLRNSTKYKADGTKKDNSEDEKGYGDIFDDIDDNPVCKMKQKLAKNEKTNETKISIDGHENLVCNQNVISNSDYGVAECPANTYHAGTNAYYWLANNLISNTSVYEEALAGINSAEAIDKFCNDKSLEKFEGGYEPIISEDGNATLDDCLRAGIALDKCQSNAGTTYECTDGKSVTSDVSYYVYLKAKQKNIDITNKTEMNSILKEVKKTNLYCTDDCYNNNSNKKDFVYRTISLDEEKNAFPGTEGNGRNPGANWDSDDLIKKIITSTKDIYTKEPMYRIELNSSDIKKIRDYNEKYSYDNFDLTCDSNGASCVSDFLNNEITVTGKCANVTSNADSFYGTGCVNYNARGE